MEIYREFWAKSNPEKSLLHHSIDVGCCAQLILEEGCGRGSLAQRIPSE